MREVDALDLFRCVVQHRAALKRDGAQMRRQQCKVVWRQYCQEMVESSVTRDDLPRGDRGVPAVRALDRFGKRSEGGHGALLFNQAGARPVSQPPTPGQGRCR
jgi:hypothetical protein